MGEGAHIKNLNIVSGNIEASSDRSAGAIAGATLSSFVIENCMNIGCTISAPNNVGNYTIGGIVGYVTAFTRKKVNGDEVENIKYCGNFTSVTNSCEGDAVAGGIVGIANNARIRYCMNSGEISAGTSSTLLYVGVSPSL